MTAAASVTETTTPSSPGIVVGLASRGIKASHRTPRWWRICRSPSIPPAGTSCRDFDFSGSNGIDSPSSCLMISVFRLDVGVVVVVLLWYACVSSVWYSKVRHEIPGTAVCCSLQTNTFKEHVYCVSYFEVHYYLIVMRTK